MRVCLLLASQWYAACMRYCECAPLKLLQVTLQLCNLPLGDHTRPIYLSHHAATSVMCLAALDELCFISLIRLLTPAQMA